MTLQRLVLTYTPEGVELRALYRSSSGPAPNTKARRQQVTELARAGLVGALEALEGRVDVVGTSGFETREDTLSVEATKGAACLEDASAVGWRLSRPAHHLRHARPMPAGA